MDHVLVEVFQIVDEEARISRFPDQVVDEEGVPRGGVEQPMIEERHMQGLINLLISLFSETTHGCLEWPFLTFNLFLIDLFLFIVFLLFTPCQDRVDYTRSAKSRNSNIRYPNNFQSFFYAL